MPSGTNHSHEDLQQLLCEVCNSPEDNAPRLAYATALETAGYLADPARAEFIRVQCELARTDLSDESWEELTDRREKLEAEHRERWMKEFPVLKGVIWLPGFERGFLEHVACRGTDAFWRHAPTIFAAAPIRSLSLSTPVDLKRIVAVSGVSRLKRLILHECQLGADDAHTLATSPNLAGITALHLSGNRLGDAGIIALAASHYLSRLDNLDVGYNKIGDAGVTALAESPIVATLTHLGLAGSAFTDKGAAALSNSRYLANLTGLTLWGCKRIGPVGKTALKGRFGDGVSFVD